MRANTNLRRGGFTLVELLVVIAIIAFLAALLVAFFPSINSQTAEANGAANLQGWLNIARQKAVRNQNPYGLRLWVNSNTNSLGLNNLAQLWVTECSYIEQPEDYNGGTQAMMTTPQGPPPSTSVVVITGVDVSNGFYVTNPANYYTQNPSQYDPTPYSVQPGDYLEVFRSGLMHSVATQWVNGPPIQVQLNNGVYTSIIYLNSPLPTPINGNGTTNYRFMRQPRVIGEERLPLPDGVFVDLKTNTTYGNTLPVTQVPPPPSPATGAYVDVLFSPSGAVITPTLSSSTMIFWVRQPDANNPANVFAGTPSLIAVTRDTGFTGAYVPTQSGNNPYLDVK